MTERDEIVRIGNQWYTVADEDREEIRNLQFENIINATKDDYRNEKRDRIWCGRHF